MSTLGFNNLIIANNDFSESNIEKTFSFILRHGFRRIIFLYDFDVYSDRLPRHLEDISNLSSHIKKYKPYGVSATIESNVIFTRDTAYYDKLSMLSNRKTKHLFIGMLPFDGETWYDRSMGHLINHRRLTPVFTSFERALLSNTESFSSYLISTQPAAFSIDINSFISPAMLPYIKRLIAANRLIIPTISGVIEDYVALSENLQYFRQMIGEVNYTKLFLNVTKSNKLFIK